MDPIPPLDLVRLLIAYNAAYCVLLCLNKACRSAISTVIVFRHPQRWYWLANYLCRVSQNYANQLLEALSPDQLLSLSNGGLQHPYLQVHQALQCRRCLLVLGSCKAIQQHINIVHGSKHQSDQKVYQAVPAQT